MYNIQGAMLESQRSSEEILKDLRSELTKQQDQFRKYCADQERQRVQDKLEQSETDKKIRRSSWIQTVFALIAAPLITLLIEHSDLVANWLSSIVHGW